MQKGKSIKKSSPNYITSIVSVALVLVILGFLGLFFLQSTYISKSFKENITLQLELKDNIKESDIFQYRKILEAEKFVKNVSYISKEDAAKNMENELGENFIEILGFNPLFASLNIGLHAEYAQPDSLVWIKEKIIASNNVKDIIYDDVLVDAINKNTRTLTLIILGVSILIFVIALILIDSTIRLAMFSNRFLIRSMQLVGATRWFIIKPFILKGILNGLVSGILAALTLVGLIFYTETKFPEIVIIQHQLDFIIVLASMIVLGVLISWLSTHRAVLKYLNVKLDNLY